MYTFELPVESSDIESLRNFLSLTILLFILFCNIVLLLVTIYTDTSPGF